MAEYSGFFNSTPNDRREYNASEFAEYFHRFISDGVYSEGGQMGLRVTAEKGLNINIDNGFAYIRGYLYKNDGSLIRDLDSADGALNRIDRVVLRLDEIAREIKVVVKTGKFASRPIPPRLEDAGTIKELPLAQVRVNANSSSLIVTDERIPVASLLEIPFDDMRASFDEWFYNFKEGLEVDSDVLLFEDKSELSEYSGVRYKMVVIEGQPYMEVVANEQT